MNEEVKRKIESIEIQIASKKLKNDGLAIEYWFLPYGGFHNNGIRFNLAIVDKSEANQNFSLATYELKAIDGAIFIRLHEIEYRFQSISENTSLKTIELTLVDGLGKEIVFRQAD